jgi:hypothetical protein
MVSGKFMRSFRFIERDTCKQEWNFTLSEKKDGLIIENLQVTPHLNGEGNPQGCLGHPLSIIALIRGLPVESINIEALTKAGCARNVACGQALAKCLWKLKAELAERI